MMPSKSLFWNKQKNINLSKSHNDNRITDNLVKLPKHYEFRDLDIINDDDSSTIYMFHNFIKNNYTKQQNYSIEYLRWRFKYSNKNFIIGLFSKNKNKYKNRNKKLSSNFKDIDKDEDLIGTICACPTRLYIGKGEIIDVLYITFLCVKKDLRGKKIAPILISEMIRRWKNSKIYKFPIFVIEDKPLPNMNIEKKILYNIEPIKLFNNYVNDEKNKNKNKIHFVKIDENDDKSIEEAFNLYNNLAKNEWAVYHHMDLSEFKHYLFNNRLKIYTYFIIDDNFDKIGLITTINISVPINSKLIKNNHHKIAFIQYLLFDKSYIIANSDLDVETYNDDPKFMKIVVQKYRKKIINQFMKTLNNDKSLKYLAYISDYNSDTNNIISKYIYRKGYIHTYNHTFQININQKQFNVLDNGFMMLHL